MLFPKKIIIIFIFIFSIFTVLAVSVFHGTGTDVGVGGKVDILNLNSDLINQYDTSSDEYINELKRFSLGATQTFFDSEHYGDYFVNSTLFFTSKDTTKNTKCIDNIISYSFSGTLLSEYWGELTILPNNDNYYCPATNNFSIPFDSLVTGTMIIKNSSNMEKVTITDSYGNEEEISISNVFDDKKIEINGIYTGNSSLISGETSEPLNNSKGIELIGNTTKIDINKSINKNIALLTRYIDEDDIIYNLNDLSTKDLYYYNEEGNDEVSESHEENKGKILKIQKGSNLGTEILEVDGEKTIIVKGGNVYINTNISNKNKDSLLVIVAKRDSTNMKNGGNIYINPNVTNIDAILIADGSILNYNGSSTSFTDIELRKQLLIYGSIYTKNTLGEDISVYGTDHYIKNNGVYEDSTEYNLENLRTFQTILSNGLDSLDTCYNSELKIVAMGDNNTQSRQKAFAGKKNCYIDNTVEATLRSTDSFAGLVITHNPRISTSQLQILQVD